MTTPTQTQIGAAANTDRELWREREGDYYAASIHVTKDGGIGMNVGGSVFVMPIQKWHSLAAAQVEGPSKECWVNETHLNNAIAATIERCAQVADKYYEAGHSGQIAAAIRKLKDDPA